MTVPKRFGVLRFFATLLKVIAWIVLIGSVLGAVIAIVASNTLAGLLGGVEGAELLLAGGMAGGIAIGIAIVLYGLINFFLLYVAGESISLQLAVEENTRLTAALLLRMHQEGQAADTNVSPYGAGGGFVNEPYE